MYLHFLCTWSVARNTVCVLAVKDVQKSEFHNFSWNDQPMGYHTPTVQSRIRAVGVRRTKKVMVELKDGELANYYDGKCYYFKGKKIKGPADLEQEMVNRLANKEIGNLKRQATRSKNKTNRMEDSTEIERLKIIQQRIIAKAKEKVDNYKNKSISQETDPTGQSS